MPSQNLETFLAEIGTTSSPLSLIVTPADPGLFGLPPIQNDIAVANIYEETSTEEVLSLLIDCAARSRWCRLNLMTAAIDPRLYNALRGVSTNGHLNFLRGEEVVDVAWPAEAKIFCCLAEPTLRAITIPTFLNLFGPVYRSI